MGARPQFIKAAELSRVIRTGHSVYDCFGDGHAAEKIVAMLKIDR